MKYAKLKNEEELIRLQDVLRAARTKTGIVGFRDQSVMPNKNFLLLDCIGSSLRGTLSQDDIR